MLDTLGLMQTRTISLEQWERLLFDRSRRISVMAKHRMLPRLGALECLCLPKDGLWKRALKPQDMKVVECDFQSRLALGDKWLDRRGIFHEEPERDKRGMPISPPMKGAEPKTRHVVTVWGVQESCWLLLTIACAVYSVLVRRIKEKDEVVARLEVPTQIFARQYLLSEISRFLKDSLLSPFGVWLTLGGAITDWRNKLKDDLSYAERFANEVEHEDQMVNHLLANTGNTEF